MGTRHYNSPTTAWELTDPNIKPLLLHNRVNSDYANGMIGDVLFFAVFPSVQEAPMGWQDKSCKLIKHDVTFA